MDAKDRELLELAAKAYGYERLHEMPIARDLSFFMVEEGDGKFVPWNPIKQDGDALRLAVKLRIEIERAADGDVYAGPRKKAKWLEELGDHEDDNAAVRYAIVCAAADIGRKM